VQFVQTLSELRAVQFHRQPQENYRPVIALVVLLADNEPVARVEVCYQ
jgi:hypothetical protein